VYLGRISYGMYLIHIIFFWIMFAKVRPWMTQITADADVLGWRDNIGMALAFAATVIIASLLCRCFETPFLKLKRRFTAVPSRD
jgi:peptidoglycan/LPS O-acetylase OafA/YrhL